MTMGELIPTVLGLLLTLAVFTYFWRDNPLFRLAIHLFIGVAAGYAGALALRSVIIPKIFLPLGDAAGGGALEILVLVLPPALLGLLLFAKLSPQLAWLGSPTMAYLVGVGAAAAIGGAVLGTLFPQISATTAVIDLESTIVLIGTVFTLMYFHFGGRSPDQAPSVRSRVLEVLSWGGQGFIAITFGVLFAGVYSAALAALIERLNFVINAVLGIF